LANQNYFCKAILGLLLSTNSEELGSELKTQHKLNRTETYKYTLKICVFPRII